MAMPFLLLSRSALFIIVLNPAQGWIRDLRQDTDDQVKAAAEVSGVNEQHANSSRQNIHNGSSHFNYKLSVKPTRKTTAQLQQSLFGHARTTCFTGGWCNFKLTVNNIKDVINRKSCNNSNTGKHKQNRMS